MSEGNNTIENNGNNNNHSEANAMNINQDVNGQGEKAKYDYGNSQYELYNQCLNDEGLKHLATTINTCEEGKFYIILIFIINFRNGKAKIGRKVKRAK